MPSWVVLLAFFAVLPNPAMAEKLCNGFNIPDAFDCVYCDLGVAGATSANVATKVADTCPSNTTVLFLAFNPDLTALPSDLFSDLPGLLVINLWNCGLTALPAGLFDNNTELYDVDVSDNNIGNGGLPQGLFKSNPNLAKMYLDPNPFTSVPAGLLDNQNNLSVWVWPDAAKCTADDVGNTCEARTIPNDPTVYYTVVPEPTAEPTTEATADPTRFEAPFEYKAVVCLQEKTKLKCPKGEFFQLASAFFGRSDVADTTCAANYKAYPDRTCAANEQPLASDLQEKCNGARTCKLKNRKKQRKAYGLHESCNPFLQVQYNCVRNVGPVQKKKQVKKARKQAKRTGDWDAFFNMLSPAAA